MKRIFNAIIFLVLLASQFPVMGQNSTIEKYEMELEQLDGSDYCEKALFISDLYLGINQYDKATAYADVAYTNAALLGRKDLMAQALNRQAKAKLKNKGLKKKERLAALKELSKSIKLMSAYEIDNIDLEKDNIQALVEAGKEFIGAEGAEMEEMLEVTFDSIKFDLSSMPKKTIKVEAFSYESPNAPVSNHVKQKRKQQAEYQQKIMEMNLAKVESDMKMAKGGSVEVSATAKAIEDFIYLPQLKEQWRPKKEELEKEFAKETERIERMDAMEIKEELLLAEFKNKYDSLAYIHTMDSVNLEKKELALRKQEAEVARQKAQHSLMMVGSGGAIVLSLLFLFGFVRQKKSNHLLTQKNAEIQHEQERSQELLLNILPAEVAHELKQYGAAKAHRYDEVTVLFSDFQNFTKIAEKLTPEKLIQELDYCFKAFDRIIEKYKLEKIKTIGDAYLCAGGVPSPDPGHISRCINAALEMQQFLEKWKLEKKEKGEVFFEARMGLHTGPIIAGVVGVKKFAYDIWGDTVNIASRMESAGEVGKVNISEKTFELIKDEFQFINRGKIAIKNKGEINMYFVEN